MNKNIISRVLVVLFIIIMSAAFFWSWKQNQELEASLKELTVANKKILEKNKVLEKYSYDLLENSSGDLWEIATATNTLLAYSNYAQIDSARIKQKELNTAVKNLLSKTGYVEYIETDGNKLFTPVKLTLDGDFVRFKTDKAIRTGAIGIPNCGSSNAGKTDDIILKGKIIKIIELCEAQASESVWAHIAY